MSQTSGTRPTSRRVLVSGATGYVGGRLRRILEHQDYQVRCLGRHTESLKARVAAGTEVVYGDVLKAETLMPASEGVDAAYYLVHSMGSGGDFRKMDRQAAQNFGQACRKQKVGKIVYLGGLGGRDLSPHLASRQEVGRILRRCGVPTIEFQASIVIGSGSLSFEMIRHLVNRLPIMIAPRWVQKKAQPISIDDVLRYLVEALEQRIDSSVIYQIGGAYTASYREIMKEYARQRGLRRLIIPVPLLTPRLSSLWLGLVTPVYARTGRKLIDSIKNSTVVTDHRALVNFSVLPAGLADAIFHALANENRQFAETRWSDAFSSKGTEADSGTAVYGTRIVDSRTGTTNRAAAEAFRPIQRIGGSRGWYYADWLWRLRGFIDLLAGGVGTRRGRRHAQRVGVGDAIDFWRVEAYSPHSLLRLRAEMKLPGRAWLQFEVEPKSKGSLIRQTAIFDPLGLPGQLYWYLLYPFHRLIFQGMLRNIVREVEASPKQRLDSIPAKREREMV